KDVKGVILPIVRPNTEHSFHVFGIKVQKREELQSFLKQKGIPTQIHYPRAMPFMPAYAYQSARPEDYPHAYDLQNRELSLPIYPEMRDEEVEYVCDNIRDFLS